MTARIIGLIIILVAILFLPYWAYLPILFAGVIIFPFFWEGVLLALLVKAIHGPGMEVLSAFTSPLALCVLAVLVLLLPIKENLRTYV